MAHWDLVKDGQIYTVDVGIACVGLKSKLPNSPKRKTHESDDDFEKRVNRWIDKRQLTEREWEAIAWERQDKFEIYDNYQGNIIKGFQSKVVYIIGASADLELGKLREKIAKIY
jgi:hypothetical protein